MCVLLENNETMYQWNGNDTPWISNFVDSCLYDFQLNYIYNYSTLFINSNYNGNFNCHLSSEIRIIIKI